MICTIVQPSTLLTSFKQWVMYRRIQEGPPELLSFEHKLGVETKNELAKIKADLASN